MFRPLIISVALAVSGLSACSDDNAAETTAAALRIVSDLDPDIAFAFKFAKSATPEELERLR